jgi:hypothetical protein
MTARTKTEKEQQISAALRNDKQKNHHNKSKDRCGGSPLFDKLTVRMTTVRGDPL